MVDQKRTPGHRLYDPLLDQALDDPKAAIRAAESLLVRADANEQAALLRVLGVAARALSDGLGSLEFLDRSIDLAEGLQLKELAGLGRLSRALTLSSLGHTERALADVDAAEHALDGLDRANLEFQRGSILLQLGQPADALAAFDRALPEFVAAERLAWTGDLLANRGIAHIYQGSLRHAEQDLQTAIGIFTALGAEGSAAETEFNLAFLRGRQGDIVAALSLFESAEAKMVTLGRPIGELPADRAETLLSAGLFTEAAEAAETAAIAQERAGLVSLRGESLLLLARASLLGAEPRKAGLLARQAQELFDQQDRPGWSAQAELVALRAQFVVGESGRTQARSARQLVDDLARRDQRAAATIAAVLAARMALATGDIEEAAGLLTGTDWLRRQGPVEARAEYWLAIAEFRLARGEGGAAARASLAGLDAVDRHRALLSATDARAHISLHATDLAELGLWLAVDSGDGRRVLRWIERSRAAVLDIAPVRPTPDPVLNADLESLRATMAEISEAELSLRPDYGLRRRQGELQRRISRRARLGTSAVSSASSSLDIPQLQKALGSDTELVSLAISANRLWAVLVNERRCRMVNLAPVDEAVSSTNHLRFSLTRALHRPSTRSIAGLWQAAAAVDELIGRRLPLTSPRLLVSPPPPLFGVPWATLPSLADKAISLVPSARSWVRRARRRTPVDGSAAVVVAGPALTFAEAERRALKALYPDGRSFDGARTAARTVLAALEGASVAHIACHGRVIDENPLFSTLDVGADGPLTLHELGRLSKAPELVVLSACDGGLTSTRRGAEMMGFWSSLLAQGTGAVIAPMAQLPDTTNTVDIMVRLHRALLTGASPAETLLAVADGTVPGGGLSSVIARCLVCVGNG